MKAKTREQKFLLDVMRLQRRCERGNRKHFKPESDLRFAGIADLLLSCGRFFEAHGTSHLLGIPKACFGNCVHYIKTTRRLKESPFLYCEGFAIPDCIEVPIYHAWLCTRAGEIIDPTWGKSARTYLGIAIRSEIVLKIQTPRCQSILDNYEKRHPLLSMKPSDFLAEITNTKQKPT